MTASFDTAVAEWIAHHRFGPLNGFFVALGSVEKLGAIWILCAIALGIAARRGVLRTIVLAVVTVLTTFAADSVSFGVKDMTHRTRPFVAHHDIHPLYVVHSSSFPAGHAATAFAGATVLTYVAPRLWPLFAGLAAAVAYSLLYVGVHYPTDVLAGAAIGVIVGGLGVAALVVLERWKPRLRVASHHAAPA